MARAASHTGRYLKGLSFMTKEERQSLETYKAERNRGIVHTPEWRQYMFRLEGEWETEMRKNPLGPHSWSQKPRGFWSPLLKIFGRYYTWRTHESR